MEIKFLITIRVNNVGVVFILKMLQLWATPSMLTSDTSTSTNILKMELSRLSLSRVKTMILTSLQKISEELYHAHVDMIIAEHNHFVWVCIFLSLHQDYEKEEC